MSANQQEWLQLQRSVDAMEPHALWLKVSCLLSWLTLVFIHESLLIQLGAVLLFWFFEASWRIQQGRAIARLLALEQAIKNNQDLACSWQSQWQANRSGFVGLCQEYMAYAVKPTVAVLYVGLVLASIYRHFH